MTELGSLTDKTLMDIIERIEELSEPLRGQFTDD